MAETVQRRAPKGPGPKGSKKQVIVKRWTQGSFRMARLLCGHEIRITKGFNWMEGAPIACPYCPRK